MCKPAWKRLVKARKDGGICRPCGLCEEGVVNSEEAERPLPITFFVVVGVFFFC